MEVAKRLRDITKADAIENYKELQAARCTDLAKHSRMGLKTLDYFFLKHRIRAKTRHHISFFEALKDPEYMSYLNSKAAKVRGVNVSTLTEDEHLRLRYNLFQLYYGSINQFRPTEAMKLYCRFQPKVGILDFSAGWGGRCLAAMAYGVPYIGIDANEKMEATYKDMIETLDPKADVTMIFKPSETVDFSKFNYDLVFTSPPYFMIEEYEKMPAYGSKEGFLDKFFRPVVLEAWKHLKTGGHMALNMPKEMYDAVKDLLPPLHTRLRLAVMSRHPSNAAAGRKIGVKDAARSEGIYIWKKGGKGRQTRKAIKKSTS